MRSSELDLFPFFINSEDLPTLPTMVESTTVRSTVSQPPSAFVLWADSERALTCPPLLLLSQA